jgi:FkbM family methyltransferase
MQIKQKLHGLKAMTKFDNWLQVVINRLIFTKTGCIVYRIDELEIIVDQLGGDANGVRECLTSKMYSDLIEVIVKDGGEIRNLIDIGANGGGFTLLSCLMGLPLKQIICVEMNSHVFGRLSFNLFQNLKGISLTLINGAIAEKSGDLEVSLSRGSTGDSILSCGGEETVQIKKLSFNDIIKLISDTTVDLCKIDVEGAEYEVIMGEECSSITRLRYLIMEIHEVADYTPETLILRLHNLGFIDISPINRTEQAVYLFRNNRFPISNI